MVQKMALNKSSKLLVLGMPRPQARVGFPPKLDVVPPGKCTQINNQIEMRGKRQSNTT